MNKQLILSIALVFMAIRTYSQVGINIDNSTPHPSAMLDVKSDSRGLLPPRMTTSQRDAIIEPAAGLIIFNIDCNDIQYFDGSHFIPVGNMGMLANPGSISGNSAPCEGSIGQVYSVSAVAKATGYHWIVPPGPIITSGQGTTSITVSFDTTGEAISVFAFNNCFKSEMSCLIIALSPTLDVGVSISPSANPVCSGTVVTFTAIPENGGLSPQYVWKVNGSIVPGAENSNFNHIPADNEQIRCELFSSEPCINGNPAESNTVIMSVQPNPSSPLHGTNISSQTQIIWNWNTVTGATGYKWSSTIDYGSATDMGLAITKTETGLTCNIGYTRYVWAYDTCGISNPTTLTATTSSCWNCGNSLSISHVAGAVAPVNKSVSYGTVTNIPGEPDKCWITRNLGASQQAANVSDNTEPSAGWYWQFNQQQGYKHDGTTRTPNTTWLSSISENSNWVASSDPCTIELGTGWRIPTSTEWFNVDNAGGWININGPWNSALKLHCAGYLNYPNGILAYRGTNGIYWSSTQHDVSQGKHLYFFSNTSYVWQTYKSCGSNLRCLNDF